MKYIIFSLMIIGMLIYSLGIIQQKGYDTEIQEGVSKFENVKLDTKEKTRKNYLLGEIIGLIEIPRIDIRLPIIEGTTENVLKTGVGHITGTPQFGENGNSFVSGHRSWTYGKLFNRLNEIVIDDQITIKVDLQVYTYQVYKIEIVEPDNIEVFNQLDGERNLTLTTCTPLYKATHRLIVYSKLL
jgi:sortase A